MHSQTSVATWRPSRLDGWRLDLVGSLCAGLLVLALHAAQGFPTLFDSGGDSDAMMRLAQIRDLIGGQGWFNLRQYRMGPEGGFVMHWSRIVDAPVAAIILLATAVTGSAASGEAIASVVWPTLLLVGSLFFLLRASRQMAGPDAFLPTLVIGAITLHMIGLFAPRSLDHHNLQLTLSLATLSLLMAPGWRAAALAGLCCATMLAIGMETLPYVAIAGACVAVGLLKNGGSFAGSAAGFGIGFAASALIAVLATVPFQSWWTPQCDMYSAGLGMLAIGAGLGLAAIASLTAESSLRARALAICGLAALTGLAAILLVPQCFQEPYASMDPRLRTFWIDEITEAQPLWRMLKFEASNVPQYYATPLLAAALLLAALLRRPARREEAVMAAFLVGAIVVSIWQVRGANFSVPFAVIPLSAWVATARRSAENRLPGSVLRLVFAWLLSLNLVWGAAANGIADIIKPMTSRGTEALKSERGADPKCHADSTYGELARRPATTVLTISNLGALVLSNTPHRSLAGPSHRNVEGNTLALDAFMGSADEARAIVGRGKATLLAFCPGNGESTLLARWAPNGLMADLIAGRTPLWLEPLPEAASDDLMLYRVR